MSDAARDLLRDLLAEALAGTNGNAPAPVYPPPPVAAVHRPSGWSGGPEPVVITLDRPAKVFNDANPDVVIDGGGLVTLSGGGTTRILYMNTCDPDQHWTSAHCDNQDTPRLTVQNLTFVEGSSSSEVDYDGGGAIWSRIARSGST